MRVKVLAAGVAFGDLLWMSGVASQHGVVVHTSIWWRPTGAKSKGVSVRDRN